MNRWSWWLQNQFITSRSTVNAQYDGITVGGDDDADDGTDDDDDDDDEADAVDERDQEGVR